MLVGLSTPPPQIDAALPTAPDGSPYVDYIGVGPVHVTPTKLGRPPVGTELVSYASAHAHVPFFAIGGIDSENILAVLDAGASRVCVLRAICAARDPERAALTLRAALELRSWMAMADASDVPSAIEQVESHPSAIEQVEPSIRAARARATSELVPPCARSRATRGAARRDGARGRACDRGACERAHRPRPRPPRRLAARRALPRGVLLLLAWGMYRRRYWAVLGFEALLAFQIIVTSLALIVAATLLAAALCALSIGLAGWLFWKLVRVMGRIQAGEQASRGGET